MHVALLGARGFGQHHLRGLQRSPYVDAITLVGRDPTALAGDKSATKVRRVVTEWAAALQDPDVDLVDVVLPHDLHLPAALEAFRNGKHVLMEKPPARTPGEFAAMREAADKAGRRLFVVMNLLFCPVHHAVRRALDRGDVGVPFLSLEVNLGRGLAIYQDPHNWRADRERCGGGLQIDGGFHGVYRQLYFFENLGAPARLTADSAQIGLTEPGKGEDFAALTFAYPSGARVHLMNQWTARADLGRFPSGILGTEGSLVFTGNERSPIALRRPGGSEESIPIPQGPRGFAETVGACVEHYVECLATGAQPWADLDLAALTQEIIGSVYDIGAWGGSRSLCGSFHTRFPTSLYPLESES